MATSVRPRRDVRRSSTSFRRCWKVEGRERSGTSGHEHERANSGDRDLKRTTKTTSRRPTHCTRAVVRVATLHSLLPRFLIVASGTSKIALLQTKSRRQVRRRTGDSCEQSLRALTASLMHLRASDNTACSRLTLAEQDSALGHSVSRHPVPTPGMKSATTNF